MVTWSLKHLWEFQVFVIAAQSILERGFFNEELPLCLNFTHSQLTFLTFVARPLGWTGTLSRVKVTRVGKWNSSTCATILA